MAQGNTFSWKSFSLAGVMFGLTTAIMLWMWSERLPPHIDLVDCYIAISVMTFLGAGGVEMMKALISEYISEEALDAIFRVIGAVLFGLMAGVIMFLVMLVAAIGGSGLGNMTARVPAPPLDPSDIVVATVAAIIIAVTTFIYMLRRE